MTAGFVGAEMGYSYSYRAWTQTCKGNEELLLPNRDFPGSQKEAERLCNDWLATDPACLCFRGRDCSSIHAVITKSASMTIERDYKPECSHEMLHMGACIGCGKIFDL